MQQEDFQSFLRREGRTEKVAREVATLVEQHAEFLRGQRGGKGLGGRRAG